MRLSDRLRPQERSGSACGPRPRSRRLHGNCPERLPIDGGPDTGAGFPVPEEPVGGRPGEQSASVVARCSLVSGPTRREAADAMEHAHAHDHDDLVGQVPSDPALRIKALESVLVEKRLVDPATVDAWSSSFETGSVPTTAPGSWPGPGAIPASGSDCSPTVPAPSRRWTCWAFRGSMSSSWRTRQRCITWWSAPCAPRYPWPLLGLPPRWYKSAPYRSRAVSDPRGILREFGVELGAGVEVRVSG